MVGNNCMAAVACCECKAQLMESSRMYDLKSAHGPANHCARILLRLVQQRGAKGVRKLLGRTPAEAELIPEAELIRAAPCPTWKLEIGSVLTGTDVALMASTQG